jgi:hypothetical protein
MDCSSWEPELQFDLSFGDFPEKAKADISNSFGTLLGLAPDIRVSGVIQKFMTIPRQLPDCCATIGRLRAVMNPTSINWLRL